MAKKSKTFSWIRVDQNKMKYVEVVTPPLDKIYDKVQEEDYIVRRIDLGIQSHNSAKVDAQSSLDDLVQRYDKLRETKDHYKYWAE